MSTVTDVALDRMDCGQELYHVPKDIYELFKAFEGLPAEGLCGVVKRNPNLMRNPDPLCAVCRELRRSR